MSDGSDTFVSLGSKKAPGLIKIYLLPSCSH